MYPSDPWILKYNGQMEINTIVVQKPEQYWDNQGILPTGINRLFDILPYQLVNYNLDAAFVTKYQGKWKSVSTREYIKLSNQFSRGLLYLGVKPNDKIAIISTTNRTEWNICDIGGTPEPSYFI